VMMPPAQKPTIFEFPTTSFTAFQTDR